MNVIQRYREARIFLRPGAALELALRRDWREIALFRPKYVTGTGQVLRGVHEPEACAGRWCVVHNPSDHSMREFRTHWRSDRGIMERICTHGVGHPDPDDVAYLVSLAGHPEDQAVAARTVGVHGCDGCCSPGGYEKLQSYYAEAADVGEYLGEY